MGKPQKILTTVLWGFAVFGMFLFLALSSAKKKEADPVVALAASEDKDLPVLFDLPKFKLLKDMLMPTPGPDDDPLMHTTEFYLFDAAGKCRGRYISTVAEQMDKLTSDAQSLAARKPS